jgi:hypothetical protein
VTLTVPSAVLSTPFFDVVIDPIQALNSFNFIRCF